MNFVPTAAGLFFSQKRGIVGALDGARSLMVKLRSVAAATWVRFPSGTQNKFIMKRVNSFVIVSIVAVALLVAASFYVFKSSNREVRTTAHSTPSIYTPSDANVESSDWDLYKNERLGFSMKIPKEVEIGDIYQKAESPMRVFEDGKSNFVFVRPLYRRLYRGPERKKIENTFVSLLQESDVDQHLWKIAVQEVRNDRELEAFIQKQYFPLCKLGEKTESEQSGVFDVNIDFGSGEPDDGCYVSGKYVIKYSPEKQKAAAWDIGQDVNFVRETEDGRVVVFDNKMAESFRFE